MLLLYICGFVYVYVFIAPFKYDSFVERKVGFVKCGI